MTERFDGERFQALARQHGLTLGTPVTALATTMSTNDLALEAARQGAPHGATFVADHQTQGRGRHGRVWLAAPGESLLFSVVLRPRIALAQAQALPLGVGLALRSVVATQLTPDIRVKLKWPNDILVDGRKVCGILVESLVRGGELGAAIVGVGLNVRTREFPDELKRTATSLAALGVEVEREPLLVRCLAALANHLVTLEAHGLPGLAPELKQHDALLGSRIDVDGVVGRAAGMDGDGRLILIDENGREHLLVSGHVTLLDS